SAATTPCTYSSRVREISLLRSASHSPTRGISRGEKKETVQLRTNSAGTPTTTANKSSRGRHEGFRELRLRLLRFVLKKIPSHPLHNYEGEEGVYASLRN